MDLYGILFFIIFAETGFVIFPSCPVTPRLPSWPWCAGCHRRGRHEHLTLIGVLLAAAILGNMVNYQIGRPFGPVQLGKFALLHQGGAGKTHAFGEKHVAARHWSSLRFPLLFRTFAPVAGIGAYCPTPSSPCSTWSARQAGSSLCLWLLAIGQHALVKWQNLRCHSRHHRRVADPGRRGLRQHRAAA